MLFNPLITSKNICDTFRRYILSTFETDSETYNEQLKERNTKLSKEKKELKNEKQNLIDEANEKIRILKEQNRALENDNTLLKGENKKLDELVTKLDDSAIVYWNGGRDNSNLYHSSPNAHGMKSASKMTENRARANGFGRCSSCF